MKIRILILIVSILANFSVSGQRTLPPTDTLTEAGKIKEPIKFKLAELDTCPMNTIKDQFNNEQNREAKDTLIWKNKLRTVVTVTDLYEDTLFYMNATDKKPYHCHLSKLYSIFYKDGSKRYFEGLYMDSVAEVVSLKVPLPLPPGRDTTLYNKGIRDANTHFKHKDFWMLKKRRSPTDPSAIGIMPIWTIPLFRQFAPFSELDLKFPDKELENKSEYRAGFVYQCRILRKKHQRKTIVILLVAATLVAATLVL